MSQFDRLMFYVRRFYNSEIVCVLQNNSIKMTELCRKYSINTILESIKVNEREVSRFNFIDLIERYCIKIYELN